MSLNNSAGKLSYAFPHPNIIDPLDYCEENRQYYIVFPYLDGNDLNQIVLNSQTISLSQAFDIAGSVIHALTSIHQSGLIYRDLKPHNIMITPKNNIVIDLGLAKSINRVNPHAIGHFFGTPGWAAPEQISDSENITPAADIFALGGAIVFPGYLHSSVSRL